MIPVFVKVLLKNTPFASLFGYQRNQTNKDLSPNKPACLTDVTRTFLNLNGVFG